MAFARSHTSTTAAMSALPLDPGDNVCVHSLKSKPELNGRLAMVVAVDGISKLDNGRVYVQIQGEPQPMALKPDNLEDSGLPLGVRQFIAPQAPPAAKPSKAKVSPQANAKPKADSKAKKKTRDDYSDAEDFLISSEDEKPKKKRAKDASEDDDYSDAPSEDEKPKKKKAKAPPPTKPKADAKPKADGKAKTDWKSIKKQKHDDEGSSQPAAAAAAPAKKSSSSASKPKSKPKHDDEGGSQSSAAPAKKSTSSNGLEPLDRKKLKKNVLRIVREGDIETLTSKMVRKQLEAVFGFELKPHKEQIEEAIMAAIEKVREEQGTDLDEDEAGVKSEPGTPVY